MEWEEEGDDGELLEESLARKTSKPSVFISY